MMHGQPIIKKFFVFTSNSSLALGTTQLPIQGILVGAASWRYSRWSMRLIT